MLGLLSIFAFIDIIFQVMSGTFLMFIPIFFHVLFLRVLYIMAFKVSLDSEPGANYNASINSFRKSIITYLCAWLALDIIMASLGGSIIPVGTSFFVIVIAALFFANLNRRVKFAASKKGRASRPT